jgi:hypothetical protein
VLTFFIYISLVIEKTVTKRISLSSAASYAVDRSAAGDANYLMAIWGCPRAASLGARSRMTSFRSTCR